MFNNTTLVDTDCSMNEVPTEGTPPYAGAVYLAAAVQDAVTQHYRHTTRHRQAKGVGEQIVARSLPGALLNDVTVEEMEAFIEECEELGNAVSTINIKLSFYSTMLDRNKRKMRTPEGSPLPIPDIPWLPKSNTVKWWLNASMEPKVISWLLENHMGDVADYVQWTTRTGLRVQETLRLQRMHFDFTNGTLTIPGTKTGAAQRTVPLFTAAREIAERRFAILSEREDTYLFTFVQELEDMSPLVKLAYLRRQREAMVLDLDGDVRVARNYIPLRDVWNRVRDAFGLQRNKTATLKALRRSFAKHATDNGMPTAVLQQYLGHEDIKTTMGYLKLVGGYTVDVMRQWVT